jgi:tetratricopeptide (TPR) repeat protein
MRDAKPRSDSPRRQSLPRWKKLALGVFVSLLAFGAVEALLALVGVRPVALTHDPFVGFASNLPLFVEQSEPVDTANISAGRSTPGAGQVPAQSPAGPAQPGPATVMATAVNKLGLFNRQQFSREKPSGTYRVFCLGGSTMYGHPYDDRASPAGWLREILPRADGSRQWELINAAGISYASYRVAALMEELCQYEPDLFIIYSGHNEFLEERSYSHLAGTPGPVLEFSALLSRTRTYSVLYRWMGRPAPGRRGRDLLPGEVDALLDHSVGPSSYHRDDRLRRQILEHFEFNLGRMIDLARSHGAEVLLVVPASNLKDCSPFKSQHRQTLAPAERQQWSAAFREGMQLKGEGRLAEAAAALRQAADIDARHAESHYRLGQVLFALGQFEQARAAFVRARDEDICPLRAVSEIPEIIRGTARRRSAWLVDYESLVAEACRDKYAHQSPGRELFVDHVHPTLDGFQMLSVALAEELSRHGVARFSPGWRDAAVPAAAEAVKARIDRTAEAAALRTVAMVFSWAGKLEEAGPPALAALEILPDDRQSLFIAGAYLNQVGSWQRGTELYRLALEQEVAEDPQDVSARRFLAETLIKQGEYAAAAAHYREILRLRPQDEEIRRALDDVQQQAERSAP